jgi:DNA-binding transcriptional ArsR family regulator
VLRVDAVSLVGDLPMAAVALKPLRVRILAAARVPASATSIAAGLGLSRQSVNYHVRVLAKAGFLRRAGRQRKRGLVEQKYVVSARAFLVAPDVLGPLDEGPAERGDRFSVTYLLTLAARMQQEAGRAFRAARHEGKRVPVLALDTEFCFASPQQRAAFAEALTQAITHVVAQHTTPASKGAGAGRTYRLALGCYPL